MPRRVADADAAPRRGSSRFPALRGLVFLTPVEAEKRRREEEKERRRKASEEAKSVARDKEMQSKHAKAHRELVENARALVDDNNAGYRPPTSNATSSSRAPLSSSVDRAKAPVRLGKLDGKLDGGAAADRPRPAPLSVDEGSASDLVGGGGDPPFNLERQRHSRADRLSRATAMLYGMATSPLKRMSRRSRYNAGADGPPRDAERKSGWWASLSPSRYSRRSRVEGHDVETRAGASRWSRWGAAPRPAAHEPPAKLSDDSWWSFMGRSSSGRRSHSQNRSWSRKSKDSKGGASSKRLDEDSSLEAQRRSPPPRVRLGSKARWQPPPLSSSQMKAKVAPVAPLCGNGTVMHEAKSLAAIRAESR